MDMKWNNMESAPKDGTRILLKDKYGVYVCAWLDNNSTGRRNAKAIMCWCIPESWQDEQGGFFRIKNPIGWMHCPE